MVITHNIGALNARRQLGIVKQNKAQSMEKLSSGYKINQAADDAAGLSISEKMRKQIRGLSQGVENAQEGVGLCQVADGALAEVTEMLQRISELSVQSANGTNSDSDRAAIQEEIAHILSEIDRVGETTRYNEYRIFASGNSINPLSVSTNPIQQIQQSLSITGTPTNISSGSYTITASEIQLEINGESIDWSNVLDGQGVAIDLTNIEAGEYSFDYKGMQIAFEIGKDTSVQDLVSAIDGTTFEVESKKSTYSVMQLTDYGVVEGSDTETFLSQNGTRYLYEGGYTVLADEDGVYLQDYPNQKKSWVNLGIDLDNPGGQTIDFLDSESGVYFKAQIADGATKEEVISSFNYTKFYWGYIDMSTKENARLGYSASSISATKISDNTASLRSVQLVSFDEIYDELFEDLGYTSKASRLNDINVKVSISGTTKDDLKLTITAENGNSTDLSLYSWDPAIWEGYGYANPVFGYNDGAQVTLRSTYVSYNPPTEADAIAYLGTLGELASNVSVPSPYYFKYNTNKVSEEVYSVGDVTINNTTSGQPNIGNDKGAQKARSLWIQSGCDAGDGIVLDIEEMNSRYLGIDKLDASTMEGADKAMELIELALKKVAANRSKIGAQQNRLEHTIKNEDNIVENTTAAESRIRDTDMAEEMVEFSKNNIIAQAGHAMLAQANQSTQGVLSLLG